MNIENIRIIINDGNSSGDGGSTTPISQPLKDYIEEQILASDEIMNSSIDNRLQDYSLNSHSHDEYYASFSYIDENYYDKGEIDLKILDIDITDLLLNYSTIGHSHDDYVTTEELSLELSNIDLSDYYTKLEIDEKIDDIDISEQLLNYSLTSHSHDDRYSLTGHTHNDYLTQDSLDDYYDKGLIDLKILDIDISDQLLNYSLTTHNHDERYSLSSHTHNDYLTQDSLDDYYTKLEIDDKNYKPIIYLTLDEYDDIQVKDPDTLYVITDSDTAIDLNDFYNKQEIDDMIDDIDISEQLLNYSLTSHSHDDRYSLTSHTHDDYVTTDELNQELSNIDLSDYYTKLEIDDKNYKSIIYVTQDEYDSLQQKDPDTLYVITDSETAIDLNDFYTKQEIDIMISDIDISTQLLNYSLTSHTHDDRYSLTTHNHDDRYSLTSHSHSEYLLPADLNDYYTKQEIDDKNYKPIIYVTQDEYDDIQVKDPDSIYIITDSDTTIDLTQYSLTSHSHDLYSLTSHTHNDYVTQDGMNNYYTKTEIDNNLNNYSLSSHTHDLYSLTSHDHDDRYSLTSHTHNDYITQAELPTIPDSLSDLTNDMNFKPIVYMTQTEYDNLENIDQNTVYMIKGQSQYYNKTDIDDKLTGYSLTSHTHDLYSLTSHTHNDYLTQDDISDLGKVKYLTQAQYDALEDIDPETSYIITDRSGLLASDFYTKTEIDGKLNGYSLTSHSHDSYYYTKTEIDDMIGDIETLLTNI